jgi:hypothetical protein
MHPPTETDYVMAQIGGMAQSAIQTLWTLHHRGTGKKSTAMAMRMRGQLKEQLTKLCASMMHEAAICVAMTEAIELPREPISTARRRVLSRLPPKRKTKSASGKRPSKA